MTKAMTTKLMVALVAFSAIAPVSVAEAKYRRGARIATGIAIGVTAAALLAASSRRSHARSHYVNACNRWYRSCVRGNDYACEKFETRGCTE